MKSGITLLLAVLVLFTTTGQTQADLIFSVSFSSQANMDLSAGDKALFTDAVSFWDSIIIGHRDGVMRSWNLHVDTFSQAASEGSVLLGSAGPSALAYTNVVAGAATSDGQFIISTAGSASFNVHADAGSLQADTIKHEVAHALGFGTLWEDNEVYNDGIAANHNRTLTGGTPGQYVGASALAAYKSEFVGQSGATFVPVELGGGGGTAHGHWDESDDFGQTLTGVVDQMGRDRKFELMTGWAAAGTDFVSETTRQSFFDIGFNIVAVPEPSAFALVGMGLAALSRSRRRLSHQ